MRTLLIWSGSWLGGCLFFTLVTLLINPNWGDYYRLTVAPVPVQARIVGFDDSPKHLQIYAYRVNGKDYRKAWRVCGADVGDAVTVHFDARDPKLSFPGDPHRTFREETRQMILAGALFSTLFTAGTFFEMRKKRKKAMENAGSSGP